MCSCCTCPGPSRAGGTAGWGPGRSKGSTRSSSAARPRSGAGHKSQTPKWFSRTSRRRRRKKNSSVYLLFRPECAPVQACLRRVYSAALVSARVEEPRPPHKVVAPSRVLPRLLRGPLHVMLVNALGEGLLEVLREMLGIRRLQVPAGSWAASREPGEHRLPTAGRGAQGARTFGERGVDALPAFGRAPQRVHLSTRRRMVVVLRRHTHARNSAEAGPRRAGHR